MFSRNGRPFDRRRLACLCLVLASFQRSRVEISLADLVRTFTPAANAIDGLGFDPTISAHKAAVVDVLDWLVERGALRLSDGSLEAWARDSERGDALYDIDHDICTALFRPARPLQHLTSAAGLLDATFVSAKRGAQREAAAQRAARALVEYPVVYFAQAEPEIADALRATGVAENLARLTGLDLFMTGHDLWVTCATVPMIAHYDMYHDKTTHTVSSLLMLWDGEQLLDAAAGYADNDALVTRLLGFRPSRHAPLGTEATLYAPEPDGDGDEEDDDAESVPGE